MCRGSCCSKRQQLTITTSTTSTSTIGRQRRARSFCAATARGAPILPTPDLNTNKPHHQPTYLPPLPLRVMSSRLGGRATVFDSPGPNLHSCTMPW